MIKIVDYGLGNIQAFLNAYKRLDIPAERVTQPGQLQGATHVILPGVGAFDRAMTLFNQSGLRDPMEKIVQEGSAQVLGICVGMQMLAEGSEEGAEAGLGWVPGFVRHLDRLPKSNGLARPHMGWNDVERSPASQLLGGFVDCRFYFLHSFYFDCASAAYSIGTTEYGGRFSCAVAKAHVLGVQFHPEKSHHWGQALLGNFAHLTC
jgi:imidazole glycerol-phosphate synthase subunit HisH